MNKFELSSNQINLYNENGFIAPIDILSIQEVDNVLKEINYIELSDINHLVGTIESSSKIKGNFFHFISKGISSL